MLDVLKKTGRALLGELGGGARHAEEALERGAAGDRTHPVDRRAEEIILSALEATGEPLTAISEEAGFVELNGGGGKTVVIDPIDGSKNAVTGIPFYCTSIAAASGGRLGDVELSYIINLVTGEEFWASKGGGAFRNGEAVYTQKDDVLALALYEAQNPGRDIPLALPVLAAARRTRCLGAVALDFAYLASGAASVLISPAPSRRFDFAGGWLLLLEAGGVATDLEGKGLEGVELGLKRTSALLASANPEIHQKALGLL